MVEVGQDDQDDKVPGEDDEPDMDLDDEEEEELVPVVSKGHGGLFGADLGSIKYWKLRLKAWIVVKHKHDLRTIITEINDYKMST